MILFDHEQLKVLYKSLKDDPCIDYKIKDELVKHFENYFNQEIKNIQEVLTDS